MNGKNVWIRIRGIYATALTNLFLKAGFKITQPTPPIISRFNLQEVSINPPNATIKDGDDRKRLIIIGDPEVVDEILQLMKKIFFENIIIKKYKPELYASFLGIVKEVLETGSLINIGVCDGFLPGVFNYKKGETILVHVKKPSFNNQVVLGYGFVVNGKYLRLMEQGRISISKHIRNPQRVKDLLNLSRLLLGNSKWGIRWRSSAKLASLNDLVEEYEKLREKAANLKEKAGKLQAKAPLQLTKGEKLVELILPLQTKTILDDYRNEVLPTAIGHHYIKSINTDVEQALEVCEFLIANNLDRTKISNELSKYILNKLLFVKKPIKVIHETTEGSRIIIHGVLEKQDGETLYIKRSFKPGGKYDGLNLPKEEGDYGITIIKIGSPLTCHLYYGKNNDLKGVYVNLNTPVELADKNTIWYIDLKVDVVANLKEKTVKILDRDQLENLFKNGVISRKHLELTLKTAENVSRFLESLAEISVSQIIQLINQTPCFTNITR
ncbi:MAG: hypothetical protein DRJ47_02955 [Thermoprotei archaeon]|nr:MAG: hypothetical protein DRJ47_02955 [Thermoprotei archaeon]